MGELEVVCRKQQTEIARLELRAAKREEELAVLRLRSHNQQERLGAIQTTPTPLKLKEDHPIERMKRIVIDVCGAPPESLSQRGRKFYSQSWPRRLAMYLCYEVYRLGSSTEIAEAFHKGDHGTVLYARDSVKNDLATSEPHRTQCMICRERFDAEMRASVAS